MKQNYIKTVIKCSIYNYVWPPQKIGEYVHVPSSSIEHNQHCYMHDMCSCTTMVPLFRQKQAIEFATNSKSCSLLMARCWAQLMNADMRCQIIRASQGKRLSQHVMDMTSGSVKTSGLCGGGCTSDGTDWWAGIAVLNNHPWSSSSLCALSIACNSSSCCIHDVALDIVLPRPHRSLEKRFLC